MRSNTLLRFSGGTRLLVDEIDDCAKKMIEVMKKELPKEAQTYECCSYIISRCKDLIGGKNIQL